MTLRIEPERGEKIVILERDRNPDFVQALERGLAVIRTFSREKPAQTLCNFDGPGTSGRFASAALDNYFQKAELKPITLHTVCDPEQLRAFWPK